MKHGLSTLVAICLTGVAVTAAQAQPQVVVQDKLPASAADAPPTAPSPDVLRELRDAVEKAADQAAWWQARAAELAKDLADADVVLRVPVRITGFDESRMTHPQNTIREFLLHCSLRVVYNTPSQRGVIQRYGNFARLTTQITNGALDTVVEIGFPFVRQIMQKERGYFLRDITYECSLNYAGTSTCLHNTGSADNVCKIQGQVAETF